MARQYYYEESTSRSTTTSQTYQDKVTLTFTPDDNADYLIMAVGTLDINDAGAGGDPFCAARLYDSGNTTVLEEISDIHKDTTDQLERSFVTVLSYGASPGSQTIKLQYSNSDNTATVGIQYARIIAIRLESEDEWAIEEAPPNGGTLTDGETLTFSPATTGEYFIIGHAAVQVNQAFGDGVGINLDINGTDAGRAMLWQGGTGSYISWTQTYIDTFNTASQTIKIEYENGTSYTESVQADRMVIVALRTNTFEDFAGDNSTFRSTTTSTTYVNKMDHNDLPASQIYLVVGCSISDSTSTSESVHTRLAEDGTLICESKYEGVIASSFFEQTSNFMFYVKTYAGSAVEWTYDWKSGAGTSVGINECRITIMQLSSSVAPNNVNMDDYTSQGIVIY